MDAEARRQMPAGFFFGFFVGFRGSCLPTRKGRTLLSEAVVQLGLWRNEWPNLQLIKQKTVSVGERSGQPPDVVQFIVVQIGVHPKLFRYD
ncbi:hypothetical protein BLA18112_04447 [Burkholderia lata]|uniref:Uncharacterized protein n=1 Tax=Burkholderia lata (strain ATCC 17760 / DSM 23089 / LMG 22485 / NCIMB 9086 / R18194 / 383) TaxID=482957 RepID=A0A6P2XGF5_BURL3|nr:hypothetical protein BLA18112_04447 [Burkholderia lata]